MGKRDMLRAICTLSLIWSLSLAADDTPRTLGTVRASGKKHEIKYAYGFYQKFEPYFVFICLSPVELDKKEVDQVLDGTLITKLQDQWQAVIKMQYGPGPQGPRIIGLSLQVVTGKREEVHSYNTALMKGGVKIKGTVAPGETIEVEFELPHGKGTDLVLKTKVKLTELPSFL